MAKYTKHVRLPKRWKRFKNWCYDRWMRICGYKPYMWNIKEQRNTYVKQKELDRMVKEIEEEEEEKQYEEIFYKCKESDVWYRQKENHTHAQMAVAKALREGKDDDRIIRRPLQGK